MAIVAPGCSGSGNMTPSHPATSEPTATLAGNATPTPVATATPAATATPSSAAPLILVAGSTRTFSGSVTTTHVYASPTAGESNFTSAATLSAKTTISNAATGSPASFDVNQTVAYTVTQAATTGSQALSSNTDTFENQSMSGAATTVTEAGSKATTVSNDATSDDAGGGPYSLTTNETTTYGATPYTLGVYPLQTGSSTAEPLARTIGETQTDANAGGAEPGAAFISSQSTQVANDGSFSIARSYSSGDQRNIVENANGTAHEADTTSSFADTIGVPILANDSYTIPISITSARGNRYRKILRSPHRGRNHVDERSAAFALDFETRGPGP